MVHAAREPKDCEMSEFESQRRRRKRSLGREKVELRIHSEAGKKLTWIVHFQLDYSSSLNSRFDSSHFWNCFLGVVFPLDLNLLIIVSAVDLSVQELDLQTTSAVPKALSICSPTFVQGVHIHLIRIHFCHFLNIYSFCYSPRLKLSSPWEQQLTLESGWRQNQSKSKSKYNYVKPIPFAFLDLATLLHFRD